MCHETTLQRILKGPSLFSTQQGRCPIRGIILEEMRLLFPGSTVIVRWTSAALATHNTLHLNLTILSSREWLLAFK